MKTIIAGLAGAAAFLGLTAPAKAETTVECQSIDYQYTECWAAKLSQPQLIHQTSSSACILNRTWGYNPGSGYLWVAEGCSGVFADVGGYHYGRGGQVDANARSYDNHGHDVGAAVGGAIVAALVAGMLDGSHKDHSYNTSNRGSSSGYSGCHGSGCLVDNPDRNERSSNFDSKGKYTGCHGSGCLVDNPDNN